MLSRQKRNLKVRINAPFAAGLSVAAIIFITPAATFAAVPDLKTNPIVQDIQTVVDFLSAGVGIVVVGVIIMGGIQYTMAGDNSEAVNKAKQRMINGVIALAAFLLTFSFIEWLIPGGVF